MQPQWAAYVAQTCQGDPPWAGMAQLYVEVAPANEVFALVNAAVKNADVRSGLQVVERQYGTLELHGRDPFALREAGAAILDRLGVSAGGAGPPPLVAREGGGKGGPHPAPPVKRQRGAHPPLGGGALV